MHMKTNSFKTRIIFSTTIVFLLSLAIIVGYNAKSRLDEVTEIAVKNSALIAQNLNNDVKVKIDYTFDVLRVLSDNLSISKNKLDRSTVNEMLTSLLVKNPNFFGICTLWEPNAFDGNDKEFVKATGHDITGRFIPYWTRKNEEELRLDALTSYEIEGDGDYYQKPKKTKKECIIDPFYYKVGEKNVLMISLVSPIIIDSEFKGICGIDYELSFMQKETALLQSKIYNSKSQIEIFSNKGMIVASTISPDSIGKSIFDLEFDNADEMLKKIQRGKSETKIIGDNLVITKSFSFGKTDTPWQVRITVPYSEIVKEGKKAIWNSIIAGTLLLIVGLIIIYIMVSRLTKPLNMLVDQTNKIAQGDLSGTIKIVRKDEIGVLATSFNTMVEKLTEIIGVIIESTNNLTAGTNQIAMSSQQIAQGANEQAASAEEVSASIEEMSATIQQNSENANETERISQEGAKGILEIAEASKNSVEAIRNIAEKITIVNEIAEKTDILAINAAIEAARAGEHGKGFAVVAAEVRKLAEISQNAAKEINNLSKLNLKLTEDAGVLMGRIIPNIQKTAQLVKEIAAASAEQSSGSEQISKAIDQLSTVTQQNSSASEEMSSSSEELASQASVLKDAIMFFKIEKSSFVEAKQTIDVPISNNQNYKTKKSSITLDLSEKDEKDSEFESF